MSKTEKQLERLLSLPKDFTWQELVAVMTKHNFEVKTADGSRRKFKHQFTGKSFYIHAPHPSNIMKPYTLKEAINALRQSGEI